MQIEVLENLCDLFPLVIGICLFVFASFDEFQEGILEKKVAHAIRDVD